MKVMRILSGCFAIAVAAGMMMSCTQMPDVNSPSPTASLTPTGSNKPPVTVDVFQYRTDLKDAFEEACKQFAQRNRHVTIKIETIGEGQSYSAALRARFNSGNEPALFNINGPQDISEWQTKLKDLSDSEARLNTMEGLLDGVTIEGKVYGLPCNLEGYGFVYNKKIFEQAQIDPKSITSFRSLEEAVRILDEQKEDLGIDAVFALPAKEPDALALYMSNVFIAPEFEGNVIKTFEAKTVGFEFGDAFKQMLDFQNKYSVQPATEVDYKTQVEKLFAEGKVAIIQQGNWIYNQIEGADKKLAQEDIGILPYPVMESKEDANPVGVPMYWGINGTKPEEVQKAAVDFINWLYLSEEGKKIVTGKLKFLPAYKGFPADSASDPLGKEIMAQAEAGKTINWVFKGYPPKWAEEKLAPDLTRYLQGELTWDQVVKNAKASWSDIRN